MLAQVFISKEHEKSAFGEFSPGPTTGTVVNAIGPQKLSVKKSYPSWGFGTAKVRMSTRTKQQTNALCCPLV